MKEIQLFSISSKVECMGGEAYMMVVAVPAFASKFMRLQVRTLFQLYFWFGADSIGVSCRRGDRQ